MILVGRLWQLVMSFRSIGHVNHAVRVGTQSGPASSCSGNNWAQLDTTARLWNLKPKHVRMQTGNENTQSTVQSLKHPEANSWKCCLEKIFHVAAILINPQ